MGAIAAAFTKKGTYATSLVSAMLEEMKHRQTIAPVVLGQPQTFIPHVLNESMATKAYSNVAIGTNSAEPVFGENYAWILEGRFIPRPQPSFVHFMRDNLTHEPIRVGRQILQKLSGSYVFGVIFPDRIMIGRDAIGTVPLYFGENDSVLAAASERKALWKIGLTNLRQFQPGNLAMFSKEGHVSMPVATLKQPSQRKTRMAYAARHLQKLLNQSTIERISDVKKVCVAFSGGLDSSLVASLARLGNVSVHLICVGLAGQTENEQARQAAETLRLPLTLRIFDITKVESDLRKVLWLIEEPSAFKVGVALPFFWTAAIASQMGCHVLLAGQGADEAFGGYQRYLREFAEGGASQVRQAMYHDVLMSYKTNLQRDEAVCAYHHVKLCLPFTDARVIRYALSLPLNLKIRSANDRLRKRILRRVAKNLGIPDVIINKPKKAVQFASGVDKALKKLAKKEGLTKRSYIEKVFREVYPTVEVRAN